jgi:hypothetical protein
MSNVLNVRRFDQQLIWTGMGGHPLHSLEQVASLIGSASRADGQRFGEQEWELHHARHLRLMLP